jgi:hypothetical protein
MNELFSFCDDHFKIFILIWLKLREYYTESKSKKISLPFVIKKTSNFLKNIRRQCSKIQRFRKIAKFVYFLEIELTESERFIDKLQHLALIAEIFELPEPISGIVKHLGLDSGDDLENNVFSKKINDLFKNIDDVDLEKKVNVIEDTIQEGTLANFLKSKNNNQNNYQKNIKKDSEHAAYYNPPVKMIPQIQMRNTSINSIPRIGITPNPRTIYRHH